MNHNLVYNYDFRYFSNANYPPQEDAYIPDGWLYEDAGQRGSIQPSGEAIVIITSNDSTSLMSFSQTISEFPRWQTALCGKTVTAECHFSITANAQVSASLYDGQQRVSKTYCSKAASEVVMEIQIDVANDATELTIALESISNAAEITINAIYANVGNTALELLPCMINGVIGEVKQYIGTSIAPPEELSLCISPSSDALVGKTRLLSVLRNRFSLINGNNVTPYLPDLRGYFLRSWDNQSDIDPDAKTRQALGKNPDYKGDNPGTKQDDEFKEHQHTIAFDKDTVPKTIGDAPSIFGVTANNSDTSSVGGKETRPKNVSVLYTIKWA